MVSLEGFDGLEKTGEGPVFTLYHGVRTADGKPAVIKHIPPGKLSPSEAAHINDEYQRISGMRSEHAVPLLEFKRLSGPEGDGFLFAFERLGGTPLLDYFRSLPFNLTVFLEKALDLVQGVSDMHRAGLTHKELRPAAVMAEARTGRVVICEYPFSCLLSREDFRIFSRDILDLRMPYAAPEQFGGRMNRWIDYRSDYYSLGALFYEILGGAPPFQYDDPVRMVLAHGYEEPVYLGDLNSSIPEALCRIVMKLLEKKPGDRYQSGDGLMHDLRICLSHLQEKGEIQPFVLGKKDKPEDFRFSQPGFGRDVEAREHLSHWEAAPKARDVEEARAAMLELYQKYQTHVENTGEIIWTTNMNLTPTYISPSSERILGYTPEELFLHYNPALLTQDSVERLLEVRNERMENPEDFFRPFSIDFEIIHKNGSIRLCETQVSFLQDEQGAPSGIIGISRDVTDQRSAEKALQEKEAQLTAIVGAFEGFIYIASPDYTLHYLNDRMMEWIGRDASGETCHQAIHNRATPCPWCAMGRVTKGETVRSEMQFGKDLRWYYSLNSPARQASGGVFQQSILMDVTERKRREQALQETEKTLRQENLRLKSSMRERYKFGDIVGKSLPMQNVYELILKASESDANVIIYGESGTGKELAARAIHAMSARSKGRFVAVNCGAIPGQIMESEFFGYKKGAFTGAYADKAGYLEQARGGTLFLDEIGEIDLNLQVKLLRVIEGRGFTPVGGGEEKDTDIRIIAATNRDLAASVKKGLIREDFYYRIHIIPIHLPPLRRRKEDILLLIDHFLREFGGDSQASPLPGHVMEALLNHHWPGNVRELQNVLQRYVTLKKLDLSGLSHDKDQGGRAPQPPAEIALRGEETWNLFKAAAGFERQFISQALEREKWRKGRTADLLGISRRTLFKKMKDLGID
ncbi:sigma54 specific transcriptional regulator with PAS/PAC sensor, Fis family [Desulfatibacillum aliphaticivorans]|uniref:Sigma54 specific transcriptional regulator with PAS/PAC sensor, Fis family n=1 Tax=Desulfatibacillum aliphaticivorans TaxID=218208 RepID=B8FLZ5_DESAL|nr:sigma-54-dependent Fis family transcriptional regulator [Desulfatibacillum aliphaticivorans]ACL05728.1 sigma54 specific transcriptional regulator with PAS/PAC sensor, Fis family [Desulfatibacillum aliphaticivorans]